MFHIVEGDSYARDHDNGRIAMNLKGWPLGMVAQALQAAEKEYGSSYSAAGARPTDELGHGAWLVLTPMEGPEGPPDGR